MTHYTKDYSQLEGYKKFEAAFKDLQEFINTHDGTRFEHLTENLIEASHNARRSYLKGWMEIAGVQGYPVDAWYHYVITRRLRYTPTYVTIERHKDDVDKWLGIRISVIGVYEMEAECLVQRLTGCIVDPDEYQLAETLAKEYTSEWMIDVYECRCTFQQWLDAHIEEDCRGHTLR